MSRAVARRMVPRRTGVIVTVGSNASSVPRMQMAAYAASKAASSMFTKCLGLELAQHGIRCNVVSPGSTDTAMQRALWADEHGAQAVIEGSPEAFRVGTPIDLRQLLRNLAWRNPSGYTFAVDLPPGRDGATGGRTLIGASPELLVSRSGFQVLANPLAGSAARSADPLEDQERARALLTSPKDLHEHAVVIDAVAAALRPYCKTLDVPAGPSLVSTATMWHLSSRIIGELSDPSISSLTLAAALHPTPAVCGHPTRLAHEAIGSIEPFERGYYTGAVGWCDASGDGQWAVTLRCAEADERSLRLFAGAGIVVGSKPESELAETEAKFRTMLQAMGLGQVAEAQP